MMKKLLYLTLVTLAFVMQGCIKDYIKHIHEHYEGCGHDQDPPEDRDPTIEISRTQMIVRFDSTLLDTDKNDLRTEFGITDFEPCSCGDPNLELWGNGTDILDVEGVVGSLRGRQEAEGDFEFSFEVPEVEDFETIGIPLGQLDPEFPLSGITTFTSEPAVNIAVLDTGIDYGRKFGDQTRYLYGLFERFSCLGEISGWNFVDGSREILDDNGHGTFVTRLITDELETKGIAYRILPVKVFNGEGQGSFWNVVCAMGYIQQIQKSKGDIHILNASFGGTIDEAFFEREGLLNTMIREMEDDMLLVASAGNDSLDTDNGNLRHFPSGYEADNILAVGGYQDTGGAISIHPESNYGEISIDLAVPFEGWKVDFDGLPDVNLRGTSYSAAYVSALAAEYYMNNGMPDPSGIKTGLLSVPPAKVSPDLNDTINGSKYIEK